MKLTMIPISTAALVATLPLTAGAAGYDETDMGAEAQMALAAQVSLQQAGDLALAQHAGQLAAIGFNDENGRGVYEAVVVGADGQSWIVKLDANSGDVLGQGLASLMDDEDNGGNRATEDGGETESENDEG